MGQDKAPRAGEAPFMTADYTPRQGQYLAFIYYYTKIHNIPPAEADMQRYFRVSPPAVHEMVKTLERHGLHRHGSPVCHGRSASC